LTSITMQTSFTPNLENLRHHPKVLHGPCQRFSTQPQMLRQSNVTLVLGSSVVEAGCWFGVASAACMTLADVPWSDSQAMR